MRKRGDSSRWAGILGRALADEPRGVLVPGDATQVGLRYVESTTTKAAVWDREEQIVIQSPHGGTKIAWDAWLEKAEGWNRQRFHLESTELGADLERLVELGATRIGEEPDAVRLTDPDGSEFLVTRR